MKSHYTIPIFIPQKACPFQCVYCNQYKITDHQQSLEPEEVINTIERYLTTFPEKAVKRIGFFGGSFTGMSIEEQNRYLDIVQPYIDAGKIDTIQLSTRPDYINEEILENLKKHRVSIVELGAQSLDERILAIVGRGHSVKDVEEASKMINGYGFELGLQMMIGLPGDTREGALRTAHKIIELGAKNTRIYPTLVIKDTVLERMYNDGEYTPLSLEEAVEWCSELMQLFEANNVKILRMGLHPSEGLMNHSSLIAGPFHVSFRELVMTRIWHDRLVKIFAGRNGDEQIVIEVPKDEMRYVIGYGSANRKLLKDNMLSFDRINFS
ncbi:MAG: radical SAM protein [Bacteroidales bacterium]|nr:radical SAM protein [Bacteroidales bacterium]MBR5652256.1 radical SAM protein [Bacteroidales bacterium]MBR5720247.1 radical SAM protein [Bacteroidales bacterium]